MYLPLAFALLFQCLPALAFNKTSKRGLAYPANNNPADILNVNQTHSQISWVYAWSLDVPPYLAASNLEWVPQQWGAGNIENLSSTLQAQGAKTVLGFNEPDFDEQSNLDPAYAAQLWQKYMNPLKDAGIRLGGPAVTSSGTGQPWLAQFFSACTGCKIDFLPVHWYGVGTAGFYDYLYQIHGQFPNLPIWVTEFADTSLNGTDVLTFLNQTSVYLDGLDWVERYAWFGYFRPENGSAYNMLEADGGLNDLGKAYIGAGTVEKSGPGPAAASSAVPGGPSRTLATITVATGSFTPTFTPSSGISHWRLSSQNTMWSLVAAVGSCVLGMIWTFSL